MNDTTVLDKPRAEPIDVAAAATLMRACAATPVPAESVDTDAAATPRNATVATSRARRSRRPRITVGKVVGSTILAALVALFALMATNVASGNWQIQPVLSGSMTPGFPVGGVVVAQRVPATSLQVRDVILFHPPGEPTKTFVHRIVSLRHAGGTDIIRTQGDANRIPDPWTFRLQGKWAYEARYTVPLVGYVAVWDHSATGRQALLFLAGALIVVCGGLLLTSQLLASRRLTQAGEAEGSPATAPARHRRGVRRPSS